MSTPLLLDGLDFGRSLLTNLRLNLLREKVDAGLAGYADDLRELFDEALGEVRLFDRIWAMGCQMVSAGLTDVVHRERDVLLSASAKYAAALHELARRSREMGFDTPDVDHFEAEAAKFDLKIADMASRWQTAEDLEDLVAESLAPSRERLRAIRDSLPFPQAWHEETSKPF